MNIRSFSPSRCVFAILSAVAVLCAAAWLRANPEDNLPVAITRAQRPLGPVAVLSWSSTPGASYKVQFRTALSGAAAWQDFDVVTATGATSSAEVPLSLLGTSNPSQGFFRLVLPQPAIATIEPALLSTAGGELYVGGQCFAPGDLVRIGGVDYVPMLIGHTLARVFLPAGLAAGSYLIAIVRGGDVIATLDHALTITNGLALETLDPPSLPPGAPVITRSGMLPEGNYEISVLPSTGEVAGGSVGLRVPGRGLDFIWATTYRSRNGETTAMGNNWAHSYNIRCSVNGSDLDVRDGTGRHDTYFLQPDGSFSKRGFFRRGTLAGNVFTLEFADKGRWIFRPLDGTAAAGKIAQSIDRNGNAMQFLYDGAGRIAQIFDTLGRTYQVQYNAGGRIAAVIDFTGRAVTYTYYGPGDPNGPNGALHTITTPAVNGTPTGNDFPAGKTTTFTYSTGLPDARLNNNLLTVTDPKGQTSQRFVYSGSNNPFDVDFDRVVSVQRGNPADAIDRPAMFTWLAQTPAPGNGFAALKLIANDPVGNVSEHFYDSRNRLVTQLDYTGRSAAGVAVTEAANRPAGKLRAADPDFFTTTATWNLDSRPTRVTLPRGNGVGFAYERDFNPTTSPREAANLRTVSEIGTGGEALTWRMAHEPGFGTTECGPSTAPSPPCYSPTHEPTGGQLLHNASVAPASARGRGVRHYVPIDGDYNNDGCDTIGLYVPPELEGDPDRPIVIGSVFMGIDSISPVGGRALANCGVFMGIDSIPPPTNGSVNFVEVEGDPDQPIIIGSVFNISPFDLFPSSFTDPLGRTTTFTRDVAGNLTRAQSPLAATAHDFTYNAFGQITSHLHPANGSGSQRNDTFTYYNAGPQNGWLDTAVADAAGLALTAHFEYDAAGNVTRAVDPNGNDTLFARNALNQVVRISSAFVNGARNERDFIYDANDCIARIDVQNRDENGLLGANTHFSRTWSYDFRNAPTQRVDEIDAGDSRTTQFAYDGNRSLTQLTLPEAANGNDTANVVRFDPDERRLPFRTVRAPGAPGQTTTQFDYGLNGRLTAYWQGLESAPRLTQYQHDGLDRLVRAIDAGGNERALTLDDSGNVTRATGTGNAQIGGPPVLLSATDFSYNALNLLTQSRVSFFDPVSGVPFGDGKRTTTLSRAPNQQVTGVTDDNGHTTSFNHDTANRLARVTDARGNRRDFTRDANGNRVGVLLTDKRDSGAADEQFQTTSAYDALDRLTSAQDNVGNTSSFAYDSRGNVTRATDARGNIALSTYDGLSRLTRRVEDMDGTGTETAPDIAHAYEYDHDSRLTRTTDDNGNITTHAYDSLNRPVATQRADGTQHGSTYDVHHNVVSSLDANGTAIAFTYDLLNRLTRKDVTPGGGVSAATTFEQFSYDGMSRTLRAVNDAATVDFTYDSLSHRRSETTSGLTTASTYDAVGRRLSLTYPGGRVLTYAHDVIDRVTAVNEGAATLSATLYAGRDRIERVDYGNGTRLGIAYDGAIGAPGIPGDFGWRKPASLTHSKIAGGAVIYDRSMRWDRSQNKIARDQLTPFTPGGQTQARTFDYDADDRLIHSHVALGGVPVLDTQYQLDGEGNRAQVIGGLNPGAYTRDATAPVPADAQVNQYTQTPFDLRQYDDNGNARLTQPTTPNGTLRFLAYDYANRLVSAQLGGGLFVQYSYDALGRRISKVVQPPGPPIIVTTRFVHNGGSVIEERDAGGAVQAVMVQVPYSGQLAESGELVNGQKQMTVALRRGGQDYWLHADDTGTVFALTDASGAVVERYDYDNFGEVQFLDPAGAPIPGATQSTAGNPYLFHAARWEPEVRFYNIGGAFYDDQAGRKICVSIDFSCWDWLFGGDDPIPMGPPMPPDEEREAFEKVMGTQKKLPPLVSPPAPPPPCPPDPDGNLGQELLPISPKAIVVFLVKEVALSWWESVWNDAKAIYKGGPGPSADPRDR